MEMTHGFFANAFTPALLGHADVLDLLPTYLKDWGWRFSSEEFLRQWLLSEREVRPDVINLAVSARQAGYVTGLATNQERRRGAYLRHEMQLEQRFDHCFISSELGVMKPQAEYFRKVTEILGVAPAQIIFLDDQQHYLDAASAFGWKTILFTDCAKARNSLYQILAPQ